MKKSLVSLVAASLLAVPAMADEETKQDPNAASVSGMFKLMHIVDGAANGTTNTYDPSTGSAALVNVKFKSKTVNNFSAVLNHYTLVDTGLTDRNVATEKEASGMFINNGTTDGAEFSQLGEAYLNYATKEHKVKFGRQLFQTPLTTIKFSTMPSFFQGASYINTANPDMTISAAHMTRMSFGARAFTDAGLIGEWTNTAGTWGTSVGSTATTQGKFISFSAAKNFGNDDSKGMTSVGVDYTGVKNLTVRVWDYLIHDMANNAYVDATYKMPMGEDTKLVFGGQYLSQSYDESGITGGSTTTSSYTMMGAKVGLKAKSYNVCLSMNSSSGDAFVNVWGADPAYTSTIFSRNVYRKDVSAYKLAGSVTVAKGLKIMLEHADYGKSDGVAAANSDATETDVVVVYKPNKEMMFKVFNAIRTSEKDTASNDKTQNHIRAVATYKF